MKLQYEEEFSVKIAKTTDAIDFLYFYGYNAEDTVQCCKGGEEKEITALYSNRGNHKANVCRITRYLRNNSFTPIAHFKWTCNGKHGLAVYCNGTVHVHQK